MGGTITALRIQTKNRDRVNVYLDGHFAFGLPAIVAARLKLGQLLSDAEIEALNEQGTLESLYDQALHYLSHRPRSQAEMAHYLQRRGASEEQREAVIERLKRAGWLDDRAFAQFWIENREQFRPRGPRALAHELRRKGVENQVIEQEVGVVDEADSAYRAASQKARQFRHLDRGAFHRKVVEYLVRRGFDYEVARETAIRLWAELEAGE